MPRKKPAPQMFVTVKDMLGVPSEKIDHFCEDLRLWLHMHKQVESLQAQIGPDINLNVTTPTDAFGWIDDGKHDARIKIDLRGLTEWLQAADAVARPEGTSTE